MRLVSHKKLILERPKFAGEIIRDAAGALAHFSIRKQNRRRHEFGDFFRFDMHSAAARRIGRPRPERVGQFIPGVPARIAHEMSGHKMLQRARAIPRALVVRIKHIAQGIRRGAAGRTNAATRRHCFAVSG
jgi:hypothetical protein